MCTYLLADLCMHIIGRYLLQEYIHLYKYMFICLFIIYNLLKDILSFSSFVTDIFTTQEALVYNLDGFEYKNLNVHV